MKNMTKSYRPKFGSAAAKNKQTYDWKARQKAQAMRKQINKPQAEHQKKCPICCVEYTSKTLQEHYTTDLHKELAGMKEHWRCETRFLKTLDEQIEQKGADIPLVGLQHIRQYQPNEKEEHVYECVLCNAIFRPRTIFYHLMSVLHRINYLATSHKSMGIGKNYQVKTREQYLNLVTCATKAAEIDGRQPIKIMDHVYVPKPGQAPKPADDQKESDANPDDSESSGPPTGIGLDVINQALARVGRPGGPVPSRPGDFQSGHPASDGGSSKKQEDFIKLLSALQDARSKMPGGSLGASNQEAAMAGPAAGSGMPRATTQPKLNPLLRNPIAFTKGGQDSDPMMTGKSEDLKPETVVPEIPRLCIPDCFWCNEELYDFLGRVTVENQEEVDCVLKVTEMMSNALVRHKQRTESIKKRIEEEKKKLEEEKKAFLSKPGVNKALQKLEQTKPKSRSPSRSPPPRAAAGKRKATTDSSSSNKPLFPIGSAPVNTDPPPKAKRLMSLTFDSYRPPAARKRSPPGRKRSPPGRKRSPPGRNRSPPRTRSPPGRNRSPPRTRSPPRRLSDSSNSPAPARPGNPPESNRLQGRGATDTSKQSGPQSSQSRPSDQTLNRPQGYNTGPSATSTNPSQQQMAGSQFGQADPPSDQRPAFGQASNRPQGYTGPSTANTNPSQERMPGSQYSQSGPSSGPGAAYGQTSNKPQGYAPGISTAGNNPSQQRMAGSQFGQSRPSDLSPTFGQASNRPQGLESDFQQSQSRFGPGVDGQGPGMRQALSGSRPGQLMSALYPSRPGLGEQRPLPDQSRTQMNESGQSWLSASDSRNPALQGFGSGSREMDPYENQLRLTGRSGNDLEPSFSESRRPVNKPSWQEESMGMEESRVNESRPPVNRLGQSWLGPRPELGESRASMNDSDPTFGSRPSWQGQSALSKDQYSTTNKPRPLFAEQKRPFNEMSRTGSSVNEQRLPSTQQRPLYNEQRPLTNQSRPSYGMSDSYTESDTSYKENERFPGSQYGIGGPAAGARSYGPGAGRPGESSAYSKENERYTGSQFGNTGSTGGARPSFGPGVAGRPVGAAAGESDPYYKENERFAGSQFGTSGPAGGLKSFYGAGRPEESERFAGSQYGNTGSTGGARPSFGAAAGRPGEFYNENERLAGSQYGNSGPAGGERGSYGSGAGPAGGERGSYGSGAGPAGGERGSYGAGPAGGERGSYGSGAGRPVGSKDGYSTSSSTSYPHKFSLGSFLASQAQDSQGGQRPAAMGTSYGAAQGNLSRGPGTGAREQAYPSSQGASYNEPWN